MKGTSTGRFVRPTGNGFWDVYVGGHTVGRVVEAVMGGYFAYGDINLYGDVARLARYDFLLEAANAVARNHAEVEEWREAEARSEFIGEYGMGAVCEGFSAADAASMAAQAWEAQRVR